MTLVQIGAITAIPDTASITDIIKARQTLEETIKAQIQLLLQLKRRENIKQAEAKIASYTGGDLHPKTLHKIRLAPKKSDIDWSKRAEITVYIIAKVQEEFIKLNKSGSNNVFNGEFSFIEYYLGFIQNLDKRNYTSAMTIMEEIQRMYTFQLDFLISEYIEELAFPNNPSRARAELKRLLLEFGIEDFNQLPA